MHPCKIEWLTIPAPDLHAAKTFYENVFNFTISQHSETFYIFKAANLSGGLDQQLTANSQGIGFSITVDDIEKTLTAITQNSGTLTKTPYSLSPGAGYCAQFKDPNGNRLELYSDNPTAKDPN